MTQVTVCRSNGSHTLHHALLRLAGRDFTECLVMNLTERWYSFNATVLNAEEVVSEAKPAEGPTVKSNGDQS